MPFLTLPREIRNIIYKDLAETSNPHIILFPDVPPYVPYDGVKAQNPSDRCILRVCKLVNREASLVFPKPIYDIHIVRAATIDPIFANPLREWYEGLTEASQKQVNHIRLVLPDLDRFASRWLKNRMRKLDCLNLGVTKLNILIAEIEQYFKYLKVVELEPWPSDLLHTAMGSLLRVKAIRSVIVIRDTTDK